MADPGKDCCARSPLLAGVPGSTIHAVHARGVYLDVAAGEEVIRRWDADRFFYLVLSGRYDVFIDARLIRTIGPGDHFGELAARDWGGGYGYARLATVQLRRTRPAAETDQRGLPVADRHRAGRQGQARRDPGRTPPASIRRPDPPECHGASWFNSPLRGRGPGRLARCRRTSRRRRRSRRRSGPGPTSTRWRGPGRRRPGTARPRRTGSTAARPGGAARRPPGTSPRRESARPRDQPVPRVRAAAAICRQPSAAFRFSWALMCSFLSASACGLNLEEARSMKSMAKVPPESNLFFSHGSSIRSR